MVKIIELIFTDGELRGDGKEKAFRRVTQLWTKEGKLVAECDPCGDGTEEVCKKETFFNPDSL